MYEFLQKANDQSDLTGLMPALTRIVLKIDEINGYINNIKDKKASVQLIECQSKCQQIIKKHLPDLITHYCALTPSYRVKATVNVIKNVEGEKKLTTRDLLTENIARILEEVEIIEKNINENQLGDFMTRSHIIDEAFGVKPQVHLHGDEPMQKISLSHQVETEVSEEQNNELIMEMINQIPKKSAQERRAEQLASFKNHFLQPQSEKSSSSKIEEKPVEQSVKKEDIEVIKNNPVEPPELKKVSANIVSIQSDESQNTGFSILVLLTIMVLPVLMLGGFLINASQDNHTPVVATQTQKNTQYTSSEFLANNDSTQTQPDTQYVSSDEQIQVYGDTIARYMDGAQSYLHKKYQGTYPQNLLNDDNMASVNAKANISNLGLNDVKVLSTADDKKFQVVVNGVNKKTCDMAMKELGELSQEHHYKVDGACLAETRDGNTLVLSSD
jgi:hypothetical protein